MSPSIIGGQDQLMPLSHHAVDRTPRSRVLLVAVFAAFLLVPACSGDEQDPAAGEETPNTTTARSEPADVDVAEDATSEAPDTPSQENEGGGKSAEGNESSGNVAGIDLNADYCEIATQARKLGMFSGEGPQTPEDLAAAAERTRRITNALVRQAPDAIADDVEVSARNLSDLMSVLEAQASRTGEVGIDAADDRDVRAAMEALDSDEVQRANDRVHKWQRQNC